MQGKAAQVEDPDPDLPTAVGGELPEATDGKSQWAAQLGVVAVLGAVAVLISLVYWPGSLDADMLGELWESGTGHFTDWHAPILEALWRLPYLLGIRSPGSTLPLSVMMLLLAFYLLLRVRFSRVYATSLAVACVLFPPVLTWAVHDGNDAWFAASFLASFGALARVTRTRGRSRSISVVASIWFAFIATASRQNALPATLILFVTLAGVLSKRPHGRRGWLVPVALGVCSTVAVFSVNTCIEWAIGARKSHPVQATFIYDLAQLSKQEHRVLFPRSLDPKQNITALETDTTPRFIDPLVFSKNPPLRFPAKGRQYDELKSAWESAVLHNLGGYLKERLRLGIWMLSIGHPSFLLFEPPSTYPQYPPKYPKLNEIGYRYLSAMTIGRGHLEGNFLYDGWIYALILILGAERMLRRIPSGQIVGSMAIAMLVYTVVLAFSGPGEEYRYIYPMVATGTVMALLLMPSRQTLQRIWNGAIRRKVSKDSSHCLAYPFYPDNPRLQ